MLIQFLNSCKKERWGLVKYSLKCPKYVSPFHKAGYVNHQPINENYYLKAIRIISKSNY